MVKNWFKNRPRANFTAGYLAGQASLNEEKENECNNGKNQGKSGEKLEVPENIKDRNELAHSYEEGSTEEQKKHDYTLGLKDGEK